MKNIILKLNLKTKKLLSWYSCVPGYKSLYVTSLPFQKAPFHTIPNKNVEALNILKELIQIEECSGKASISIKKLPITTYEYKILKGYLNKIEFLLDYISILSSKGYINDKNMDLPVLRVFIEGLFNSKGKIKSKTVGHSILANTLIFNYVLLLLYKTLIEISMLKPSESNSDYEDLKADIKTLRTRALRMINPRIKDRFMCKGLQIILNNLIGYDSEYYLKSFKDNINELLSIQLASTTNIILKVPIIEDYKAKDLGLPVFFDKAGLVKALDTCICELVRDLRSMLHLDNTVLIENLLNNLQAMVEENKLIKEEVDGYYVFKFPRSKVQTLIKYLNEYTSSELINDSDNLNNKNHEESLLYLFNIINDACGKVMSEKLLNSIKNSSNKPKSRLTYKHGSNDSRIYISIKRVLTICMHESSADLSMLKDFDILKKLMDIVSRSFVTRGKPLDFKYYSELYKNSGMNLKEWKSLVIFRDTILLSPAGAKSLAQLGNIYGEEYKKVDIGSYRGGRMIELLRDNKELFEKYAIQDSLITLKHASQMEDFNFSINRLGVPLTLSGIGKNYVLKNWKDVKYEGYQYSGKYKDLHDLMTPKGARANDISHYIASFINGYRGGRNESYMFGVDTNLLQDKRVWIDYDLTSCYTTVMSLLANPEFGGAVYLFNKTVENMSANDLIFNYIVLDVMFQFPIDTKYPCIPTRVDDDVDIYPLKGRSIITGPEYLVAKSMGCKLIVKKGVMIPFDFKRIQTSKNQVSNLTYFSPYRGLIKELQYKRRQYPKKTFYNYLYKEIANSIYGQIAMGISTKKSFDIKTNSYVRINGGDLASPILASYITGFVRGLIGECLNNINKLGGRVVSSTTDGFITDIDDLENKILKLDGGGKELLLIYRKLRKFLTTFEKDDSNSDERALEVKNIESKGLISCKTRVQLGSTDGGISAATGFQTRNLDKNFLFKEFIDILNSEEQAVQFIQTGLRSASDIFRKGGHVVATLKDRTFSLEFDNKRCILDVDNGSSLLDSNPWGTITEYSRIRVLRDTVKNPVFIKGRFLSNNGSKGYKSYIETSIRGFIKACLSDTQRYGIPVDFFKNYKDIIDFVYKHEPANCLKLSISSISKLKNRKTISRTVPRNPENEAFINYVKENIIEFDSELFFKEEGKSRKEKIIN